MKPRKPRGAPAARLRQRKFALLQRYQIPETVVADLLPGSLSQSRRRCGKPTCHCATGPGHPSWYLAFMVGGTQRVEHIPAAWAAAVRRRVAAGRGINLVRVAGLSPPGQQLRLVLSTREGRWS